MPPIFTCVSLVEQLSQVDHAPLDGRYSLDDELWLVGGAAGFHIHVHLVQVDLVHVYLILHALLHTHRRTHTILSEGEGS